MRAFLGFIALLALLVGGGYYYFQRHPEALPQQLQTKQFKQLQNRVQGVIEQAKQRFLPPPEPAAAPGRARTTAQTNSASTKKVPSVKKAKATRAATPPPIPVNAVTLYLKNGGAVTGELVSETPQEVTLRFDYGDVGFRRSEIDRLVKGKEGTGDDGMTMPWENAGGQLNWTSQHDVVVKLMKGTMVDAAIASVTPEALVLMQTLPGGGEVEQTIPRKDVEQLMFKPIRNERSKQIEDNLKTLFPKMQWYEEGMFTIVTDSPPPVVKDYRRTIRELATDWYLTFHPLVTSRKPIIQQYVVIFDDWGDYIEYAASDGLPGWLAVGYFHPEDEVLYTFNMVGERFSELLQEGYLGGMRKARDEVSRQIKGSAYQETLEGQMSEFLQKFETAHAMARQLYRQRSENTLRHELVHAMFHNWKLQSIRLSQMPEQKKDELEKKRQFLQSDKIEEKRKLLEELLRQKSDTEIPDLQAANAWFVEGLAGYMEPTPLGAINQERLPDAQEALQRQQILPLEFLHVFRMGSFVGMSIGSKLYAYAQSWALCHFLMHRYPEGFLAFLDRMAGTPPQSGADTLTWLVEAIGKDHKTLDQEFLNSLKQFPPEDPFWLKQWQELIDLHNDLRTLAARLWGG